MNQKILGAMSAEDSNDGLALEATSRLLTLLLLWKMFGNKGKIKKAQPHR
jgi:hypothetical protein